MQTITGIGCVASEFVVGLYCTTSKDTCDGRSPCGGTCEADRVCRSVWTRAPTSAIRAVQVSEMGESEAAYVVTLHQLFADRSTGVGVDGARVQRVASYLDHHLNGTCANVAFRDSTSPSSVDLTGSGAVAITESKWGWCWSHAGRGGCNSALLYRPMEGELSDKCEAWSEH